MAELTASVTPQKNNRTQGNEKKRKSIRDFLQVLGTSSKDATGKESEQVDLLGTKPKLKSKAATTAKKAAKGKQKETTNSPAATRTKVVSKKTSFPLPTNRRRKPGNTS